MTTLDRSDGGGREPDAVRPGATPRDADGATVALFDGGWYLRQNPDVAATGMSALEHYLRLGAGCGRDPHPLFRADWYLARNPDARRGGQTPLRHFMMSGRHERRDPHPLFDTRYYLACHADVAGSGMPAFSHFLERGIQADRSPHRLFDAAWYRARYPDVDGSGLGAFGHFLRVGMAEHRDPHPLIDTRFYHANHPDVAGSGMPAFVHFLDHGQQGNRSPHPLFDAAWYRARYPDVDASGLGAFGHFIRIGMAEHRDPGPLFDGAWYLRRYGDAHAITGIPLEHFLRDGLERGLAPNPLFDGAWYRRQDPAVEDGTVPFRHFLEIGLAQGRSPHPLFLADWYAEQTSDTGEAVMPAYLHFLAHGMAAGRPPSPLFDAAWYRSRHPDVSASGLTPLMHFLQDGMDAGLSPHPLFDHLWYADRNRDRAAGESAFAHFLRVGLDTLRDPHSLFDSAWYAARLGGEGASGLGGGGLAPFLHYLVHGVSQGRDPCPLFRTDHFLENRAGDASETGHPLVDYVEAGKRFVGDPAPFFDHRWYVAEHGDHFGDDVSPLAHYVANPYLRPHPRFDPGSIRPESNDGRGTCDVTAPVHLVRDGAPDGPVYVVTAVTRAGLPAAKLLAESVKRHDPEVRFCVALCDSALDVALRDGPDFDEILTASSIVGEGFEAWTFARDADALCGAIKPLVLRRLLERAGCEAVIYFDAAILAFASVEPVLAALGNASVLLAPHHLSPTVPVADPGCACTLGFVAVRRDEDAFRFLSWWADCVRERSDEGWIDHAPVLFPAVGILRHPGCHVTYANSAERHLVGDLKQGFRSMDQALVFFHFGGGDDTADAPDAGVAAVALLRSYRRIRLAVGTAVEPAPRDWAFAQFAGGERIEPRYRALYARRRDVRRRFPHPFTDEGTEWESFRRWLAATNDLCFSISKGEWDLPASATPLARLLEHISINRK